MNKVSCKEKGRISRTYRKWGSMIARCYQPSHPAYRYYGGRGITVADLWRGRGGYQHFFAHLGKCPPKLTLGRIDNNLPYQPGNVRWETWKQQASNRRKRPQVPGSIRQLARAAGLRYGLVIGRIHKLGWSKEKALSTPPLPRGRISFNPTQ